MKAPNSFLVEIDLIASLVTLSLISYLHVSLIHHVLSARAGNPAVASSHVK